MALRARYTHALRRRAIGSLQVAGAGVYGRLLRGTAPDDAPILDDLRTEGVHVSSLEALLPDHAELRPTVAAAARYLRQDVPGLPMGSHLKRCVSSCDLPADQLLQLFPSLFTLGLAPRLLRLAGHYLRLPPAYHGAVLRRSLLDAECIGTRLWHRDAEDFKVLRVLVYLSDVDGGSGPFEYVPRHRTPSFRRFRRGAPIDDAAMAEVVPASAWRQCCGPAGTVVIADTAQVFHHESRQTSAERCVAMLGYSTRWPVHRRMAMDHFPAESLAPTLERLLGPAELPYLMRWRAPVVPSDAHDDGPAGGNAQAPSAHTTSPELRGLRPAR